MRRESSRRDLMQGLFVAAAVSLLPKRLTTNERTIMQNFTSGKSGTRPHRGVEPPMIGTRQEQCWHRTYTL